MVLSERDRYREQGLYDPPEEDPPSTAWFLARGFLRLAAVVFFLGVLAAFWYVIYRTTGYLPPPCDIPGTAC